MADGVQSHADLEDVLSSIRRLVSQNSTAETTAALVLTEAERVSDEDVLRPAPSPEAENTASAPVAADTAEVDAEDDEAIEALDTRRIAEKLAKISETPSKVEELDAAGMPEATVISPSIPDQPNQSEVSTPFDMNELREIVTEIVREELRGPLGQKITRNVRKLVRQEIHRATNAKSLD